jgi:hypothetical protein
MNPEISHLHAKGVFRRVFRLLTVPTKHVCSRVIEMAIVANCLTDDFKSGQTKMKECSCGLSRGIKPTSIVPYKLPG